jgi:hypothetical protein
MKIAYVPHPVSPEQKAGIRAEGFKIVDARYAPKGVELYGAPTRSTKRQPARSKKMETE